MDTAIFSVETEQEFLSFEKDYTGGVEESQHENEQQSDTEEDEVDSDVVEYPLTQPQSQYSTLKLKKRSSVFVSL